MKNTIAAVAAMLLVACYGTLNAQTNSISYFEVYTKLEHKQPNSGFTLNKDTILARINAIPDTASTIATFVFAVADPTQVDTIFLTLADSRGQQAYSAAVKVSTVQGTAAYRVGGQTIYYTVPAKPYLKRFTATLKVRNADGSLSAVRTFTKD